MESVPSQYDSSHMYNNKFLPIIINTDDQSFEPPTKSQPKPFLPLTKQQIPPTLDYDFAAMQKFKEMHMSVARLRMFLRRHNLDRVGACDIHAPQLAPQARSKLRELVAAVGKLCVETIKYDGVNVCAMISASSAKCSDLFADGMAPWSCAEPQMWIDIVQNTRLNNEQIEELLLVREKMLQRFGELFEERQELNRRVWELTKEMEEGEMEVSSQLPIGTQIEENLVEGAKVCEQELQVEVDAVCEKLKVNLRKEQTLYSLLDRRLLSILTHLQLAWGVQMCYPEHCDCLAFVNAVYVVFRQKEERFQ